MRRDVIFWDVDTQVDFVHRRGRLRVPGAEGIVDNLRLLTDHAHSHGIRIVASADDHEPGHPEISGSPDWRETFPPHCLRGTPCGPWIRRRASGCRDAGATKESASSRRRT